MRDQLALTLAVLLVGCADRHATESGPDEQTIPDPSVPIPAFDGPVRAMLHQGSSWYVGGSFTRVSPYRTQGLVELGTDGRVDGCVGGFDGPVSALARSGAALFVGGSFTSFKGAPARNIAKLDVATCTLDTTFNPPDADGFGGDDPSVYALAVAGSSVFVGGNFTSYRGESAVQIAKLDATTGDLDLTFSPAAANGFTNNQNATGGTVYALAVAGNSLLVGGTFTDYRGVMDSARALAKLDITTGAIDTTFSPVGASSNGFDCTLGVICSMEPAGAVYALAVDGDAVFVGGYFSRYRGTELSDIRLAKLDLTTGALDTTFTRAGPPLTTEGGVYDLTIVAGDLVIRGEFDPSDTYRGEYVSTLIAVDRTTGDLRRSFALDYISAYAFSDESIYVADGRSIGKYSLATGMPEYFRADLGPAVFDKQVSVLLADGDRVWVGGAFAMYGGYPMNNIVKLDDETFEPDLAFSPLGDGAANGFGDDCSYCAWVQDLAVSDTYTVRAWPFQIVSRRACRRIHDTRSLERRTHVVSRLLFSVGDDGCRRRVVRDAFAVHLHLALRELPRTRSAAVRYRLEPAHSILPGRA